jgi:restriction system protein
LLAAYGFGSVVVTQHTRDGGIDGHGLLKVGLARMAVAFQCKRWEGNVPRPEVDKFRGAIQGEFEQGIFFTTSDFSEGAMDASIKKGAVPIVLLNGESIVDLMIEKEFGVQKKPLQIYEDQLDTIFGELA